MHAKNNHEKVLFFLLYEKEKRKKEEESKRILALVHVMDMSQFWLIDDGFGQQTAPKEEAREKKDEALNAARGRGRQVGLWDPPLYCLPLWILSPCEPLEALASEHTMEFMEAPTGYLPRADRPKVPFYSTRHTFLELLHISKTDVQGRQMGIQVLGRVLEFLEFTIQ